jgi:hypothetical protein
MHICYALLYCRHVKNWTPSEAQMYPEVWKTGCDGICARIKGYSELMKQGQITEAETIYTQASACTLTSYIHTHIDRYIFPMPYMIPNVI